MLSINFEMKTKLLIQSLSPLAVLTLVKNFPYDVIWDSFSLQESVMPNCVLIVDIFCIIWIILSIVFYAEFREFTCADKKRGYQIKCIEDREENSLNFFIAFIVPLLINDVGTPSGALTFGFIVLFLYILLNRTNLFYSNPVLTVLGYRFYEFQFKENSEIQGKCVGISRNAVTEDSVIEYKLISDNVFYIKGLEYGQK